MATVQTNYPSADTVAITITLTSLLSSTTLLDGRESTAVNNTTNLDLDHLVSGKIRLGSTTPTVSRTVEVWAYAAFKIATTPSYPAAITGTDANRAMVSANVKHSALRFVHAMTSDAVANRDLFIPPTSIASLFGELPPYWGLWVVHDTGQNLNATAAEHELHYLRVRRTVA